jgi:hypothetical protein
MPVTRVVTSDLAQTCFRCESIGLPCAIVPNETHLLIERQGYDHRVCLDCVCRLLDEALE